MNEFENKLQQRPLRPIPAGWREEILSAARAARTAPAIPRPAPRASFLSTLLWPHPKAWAGLAAVWVGIGLLNFSTRETTPRETEKAAAPSPEMVVELRKQQRMFAELVGGYETQDADRPRVFAPRPRSERAQIVAT